MSSWCYSLVKEKKGLRVCEVYWKKDKPIGYLYVFRDNKTLLHWWNIMKDIPMIIYDLYLQRKHYYIINESEFNPK